MSTHSPSTANNKANAQGKQAEDQRPPTNPFAPLADMEQESTITGPKWKEKAQNHQKRRNKAYPLEHQRAPSENIEANTQPPAAGKPPQPMHHFHLNSRVKIQLRKENKPPGQVDETEDTTNPDGDDMVEDQRGVAGDDHWSTTDLEQLSDAGSLSEPWIVFDFNAFTKEANKVDGRMSKGCGKFCERIERMEMINLGFEGSRFTWKGGLFHERIDRALVNDKWRDFFVDTTVKHLPRAASDHSPLLIGFKWKNDTPPGTKIFRISLELKQRPYGDRLLNCGLKSLKVMSSNNAGSRLYGDKDPFPTVNSDEEESTTVAAGAKKKKKRLMKISEKEKKKKADVLSSKMLSSGGMASAIKEVNLSAIEYGAHRVAVAGLKRLSGDRPIKAKWFKQFLKESPKKTMYEALVKVLKKLSSEQLPLWEALCDALVKMGTPEDMAVFPGDPAIVLSKGLSDEEPIPEVLDEYIGIELEEKDDEALGEDVSDTGNSGA
ncbi:OLC1v1018587C1 [Oldenlandia corymbosa var. corymbosa]|uniref:OLC1v1018587C1 n=1 Tax=Oldenlandia corymbosa var. corymbosa TaxID=529605 RepID=A0AAV1EC11_OLDCO|nr:OLC1v1018587C1 [Oldenlandia corymbosa var. corymbosa]